MACEFIAVYAGEQAPEFWDAAVLLAEGGGGDGEPGVPSWRSAAIEALAGRWAEDGRLVVFVPDGRDGLRAERTGWDADTDGLADAVLSWRPDGSAGGSYLAGLAGGGDQAAVSLDDAARAVLAAGIGAGARRGGAERAVPLPVWRTDSFQRWLAAQRAAGNTMLGARPVWTFSPEPGGAPFYWALHVRMHILAEDRVKSNEVVISRPDISVMVLYQRRATLDGTVLVLVREFRSPARTADGFVHELPSGSGASRADAAGQAISETEEETGLAIDAARVRAYGSQQLAGTMSAHHAHLFAAEITDTELAGLRAAQSSPHGAGGSEVTWTEVTTFGEIRRSRQVDWSTLGMIAETLLEA